MMRKALVVAVILGTALLMGCFDVNMETKVNSDGSLDRTVVIETKQKDLLGAAYGGGTMGTDLDKQFFGEQKEWKKTYTTTAGEKDTSHVLKGVGHFASPAALSKEGNPVKLAKAGFFKTVYTYDEVLKLKEESADTSAKKGEEKKESTPTGMEPKFHMRVSLPGTIVKAKTNADSILGSTAVWNFVGTDKDPHLMAVSEVVNPTAMAVLFGGILVVIVIIAIAAFAALKPKKKETTPAPTA
jgi:hypothetical protein